MPRVEWVADTGEVFGQGDGPAYVWDRVSGYHYLNFPNGGNYAIVTSTTSDGEVLAGIGWNGSANSADVPAIWYRDHPMAIKIGSFPENWTAYDAAISGDGSTVTGAMKHLPTSQRAVYLWRDVGTASKFQMLNQFPPGVQHVGIHALSTNGTVGFGGSHGSGGFEAIRWTQTEGFELLGDIPGGDSSSALLTCNATGSIAAGYATPPNTIQNAALWTELTGWHLIGLLHPDDNGSEVINNAGDGWTAVGTSELGLWQQGRTAIIWNPVDGLRSLADKLENDYGLDLQGVQLTDVQAVSPNGRFLAGRGIRNNTTPVAWFAEITPFCYADCNGDKALNILDYICFGNEISQQTIYANCNNDGSMNILDYICYGNKFAESCP